MLKLVIPKSGALGLTFLIHFLLQNDAQRDESVEELDFESEHNGLQVSYQNTKCTLQTVFRININF